MADSGDRGETGEVGELEETGEKDSRLMCNWVGRGGVEKDRVDLEDPGRRGGGKMEYELRWIGPFSLCFTTVPPDSVESRDNWEATEAIARRLARVLSL